MCVCLGFYLHVEIKWKLDSCCFTGRLPAQLHGETIQFYIITCSVEHMLSPVLSYVLVEWCHIQTSNVNMCMSTSKLIYSVFLRKTRFGRTAPLSMKTTRKPKRTTAAIGLECDRGGSVAVK